MKLLIILHIVICILLDCGVFCFFSRPLRGKQYAKKIVNLLHRGLPINSFRNSYTIKVSEEFRKIESIFYKHVLKVLSIIIFSLSFDNSPSFANDNDLKFPIFNEVWRLASDNFYDNSFNKQDWNKVREEYLNKLKDGADENEITKLMVSSLGDKYTRLLDKNSFEALWKYDAIGVGLLFESDPSKQQQMVVAAPPISGSSANKANIHKGDIITSINGQSTKSMTAIQLLDMMSNDDKETVEIEYFSPDNSVDKKIVSLRRSKQKASNPVQFFSQKLKNNKVAGYIKLSEFNSEAVPSLRDALDSLNNAGIDELVLDLRGNTGGGFQFALNIGGIFMDDKNMVTAVGKGMERNVFKTSYPGGPVYTKPLLVYTDGLSASASEVLVAGLRDNCRAASIGAKTFGKGKIQAVFGLSDGEGLTMTVAQYVTPHGVVIQSKGIDPDIPLQTLNSYVNLILAPVIGKPNLENIPFDSVKQVIGKCVSDSLLEKKLDDQLLLF